MKVIFLDFDGVLNSHQYLQKCGYNGFIVDPDCMLLLKRIVDATNAKIVISTSWREHWGKSISECDGIGLLIEDVFRSYNLEIFDKTPKIGFAREIEIEKWLFQFGNIENFVVIDDAFLEADFLKCHFVRTSFHNSGLDEDSASKAISILNDVTN